MRVSFILLFVFTGVYFTKAQTVELRTDSTIINSKLRIKNHNEASGKVLTSDAKGNASWQAIPLSSAFWQIGSTSTEIIPSSPIVKVKIPGSLQIPTGAAAGRYLRSSDANGNAVWATFPSFSLSLPYYGGISSSANAFTLENSDLSGFAFNSIGNIRLQNINEKPGYILFSTDETGNAKWADGNCISKCSFSLTRTLKADISGSTVQFLPFVTKVFDICDATVFVDIQGDNDFHYFRAPVDGIYQFDFVGGFLSLNNFTLGIYTVGVGNTPSVPLFLSFRQGSNIENSHTYTATIKLNAGDKIAPTVLRNSASGSVAFNNTGISESVRFSGHIIEAINCFDKKQ